MIIFNDSISRFYQCSIWGLCWGISMFSSIWLYKKKPRIKFLGILKNTSARIKYIFVKKEKQYFEHFEYFQTWFHNADHLLYNPQMSVFSFHTFYVLLYQFLSNRTKKMLNLFIQLVKVQQQSEKKKTPGVSEYGHPEYITRQINSCILELLLRRFYCLIFASPWKS